MNTQTRIKSREYAGEADLQPICDLINFIDQYGDLDDDFATVAGWRTNLSHPETVVTRDVRIWEDDSGRMIGFGRMWFPKPGEEPVTDAYFFLRVHPEVRDQGLEEEMLEWAEGQVRQVAQERGHKALLRAGLSDGVPEYMAYRQDVLKRNGFEPVRYWFKMARDLNEPIPEPVLPEGYTLRHTEGPSEAAPWVEMFNLSFIDHWNHHDESAESHAHWLSTNPNYVKERDLVAIAPDGTWAAFCFSMIYPEDNEARGRKEGWIDILGTRRGYRKMGLGTAMLLAGMRTLKEGGMDTAVLGVDAENPSGALRLYESVGFKQVRSSTTYSKDL
ncbi:MAG TPA: GNAT family N-acetyltransferase [Chloroflexia bacterium]|nr:GNAT family N-acetyltransferase [Chloroflexia bacterium]